MIPMSIPYLYKEDKQLAIKAIKENYLAYGPQIEEFEIAFASYCGRKYGVTCNSGTSALYLAVKALKLPKNSEVIIPSMAITSLLNAVEKNGLTPIFCDVDIKTWNATYKTIKSKITSNTSAIIIVDTYGLLVNTDDIIKLKQEYPNIKIIEDAAEAHGGYHNEVKAGSIGDISTFSFYANKIITTGEGGMVLTDDEETYKQLLADRNINFVERKRYIHSEAGFNFRMTNLQCCIGLGQLQNIGKTIKHRKRIAKRYNKNLKLNKNIQLPYNGKGYDNVYWYYSIVVKDNYDKVIKALQDNNIDYRHFFYPLHKQPFINSNEPLPNSEYLAKYGVILPTYTELTNEQIDFISKIILEQL
jgi:perosamine synthetase